MPRPERALDPSAGPIQAFAAELRLLREEAGNPKYLQMQRMSGRSRTALAEAAGGDHLPTWETTEAYVRACGADPGPWREKWERLQGRTRQRTAEPSKGTTAVKVSALQNNTEAAGCSKQTEISNGELAGRADILLRMWQEQRTQARQSENQRALMTVVVAFSTLWALTYVVMRHALGLPAVFVSLGLLVLGLFGTVAAAKYYERFKMHMDGAQALRRQLGDLFPELYLEGVWSQNRHQHQRNFVVLYKVRLHHLWVAVHLGITVLGLVLTIVVFLK